MELFDASVLVGTVGNGLCFSFYCYLLKWRAVQQDYGSWFDKGKWTYPYPVV